MNLSVLNGLPTPLLVTGGCLAFLVLMFLTYFLGPALAMRFRFEGLLRKLQIQKLRGTADLADLQKLFQGDKKLAHLWKEFRDTLHEQKGERGGQTVVVALRATVLAESFFSSQYLVDSRLRTEFFKHLPGIFTGVGIIGTFLGLIVALQDFEVSANAVEAQQSVERLIRGVRDAFWVSALAIALAMVVTFVEKVLLASLYRCTEDLAQHLDRLFVSGAGEEYLSRLVKLNAERAAEEARGQIRWLRPDYQQQAAGITATQTEIETEDEGVAVAAKAVKRPWPKDATAQAKALADLLAESAALLSLDAIAAHFSAKGRWRERLEPMLDMLVVLGKARVEAAPAPARYTRSG